jgi:GNAT superfamily N-acetyltransferase
MIVRKATADDAAALADLRGHDPAEVGALAAWIEAHRETHLPFLAEVDGHAIGMAWLAVAERVPGRRMDRRFGDVQAVYVREEHQGRGVGGALLDAILAAADALGLEHMTVHSSVLAVPFYERAGFRQHRELLYWEPPRA